MAGDTIVVERNIVEPQTIDSSAKRPPLVRCEQSSIFEIVMPVFGWKDLLPSGSHATMSYDLMQQRLRKRRRTGNVSRLAVIVGDKLDHVVKRPVLLFHGSRQVLYFSRFVKGAEASARGCERNKVAQCITRAEDV